MTLASDLCSKLLGLSGAVDIAAAVLRDLQGAKQSSVTIARSPLTLRTVELRSGGPIPLRPLNGSIFIEDPDEYTDAATNLLKLLRDLRVSKGAVPPAIVKAAEDAQLVTRSLYTTVQALGFGMDLLVPPNQARKNFGMRFEEIVEALFSDLGLGHAPLNLALPYDVSTGTATFRNQVDLVVSEEEPIASRSNFLDPDEVVVSIKTSSKDRFAKIFLDKEVLRFVTDQDIPVIALFHNDVQRSGLGNVSVTFVAGNFNAYVECFGPLNGVYYIDPPPHIHREPWSAHLKTFDDLVLRDLWQIVFDR